MNFNAGKYDIVVIGAGHAGCEAALAGARLGLKTVIFSINLDSIANMPCNPSIGGTAKGQLVREIDALGGQMGKSADKTLIQSKMLNKAKGPAVYSLRAQIDRRRYQIEMKNILELQENLDLKQAEIIKILTKEEEGIKKITGVVTHTGAVYDTNAVILASGTFLKGRIIIGEISYSGGPDGLFPADRLSDSLKEIGIKLIRFKTGTPARVNKRSINFEKTVVQPGDEKIIPFSFENEDNEKFGNIEQVPCYLSGTNEETHEIIKENLDRSPLFKGDIEGVGPRYCPSIEDKVVRFKERKSHQMFIEPMGNDTQEMYLQGMSSSLPEEVQLKMYRSMPGLENVSIMRPAYAIEYDCLDPLQLKLSLEHKGIEGFYSAGQSNGSSGYEEAAAQGLIAGMNAALKLKKKEPVILKRSDAYIGVLIDDLVTKGTNEPYRMMTSRAEYRLHLRQDNADLRLLETGYNIGLINEERYKKFLRKKDMIEKEINRLKNTYVPPDKKTLGFLKGKNSTPIKTGVTLASLLKRPELTYDNINKIDNDRVKLPESVGKQVNISIKYEGYIKKQLRQIEQFKKMEERRIPDDIIYNDIKNLRLEARQKLEKIRPGSIGQASRISGVSPADISVLVVCLDKRRRQNAGPDN